jgi:catalase
VNDTEEWEKISFNPGLLTDGIAMSDDKVLKFRVEIIENPHEIVLPSVTLGRLTP